MIDQSVFPPDAGATTITHSNERDFYIVVKQNRANVSVPVRKGSVLSSGIKRCFDILVAVVALAVFSPVCIVIGLAIWMEDRHNPIFSQERIGRKGKAFTLYKFRSMVVTSEKNGKPQLCRDADDRLTKVGAFIRAHHLDEFPQLWNVLKGDMSVVGPRPERRYFIEKITKENPDYVRLYALRPGLFSEATLRNGYTDTMEKMLRRLEMDLEYLDNRSLMLDIKIIWWTTLAILTGKKF